MKTTLCKQVALMSILFFFITQSTAKTTSTANKLLSVHLLNDSLIVKTNAKMQVTTTVVTLQTPMQNFVGQYLDEHAEMLATIKQKNNSSFKLIQKILIKRGIPAELMYLAVVESKLKNTATSGAGAAGVWQLMPVTARSLGLKVNGKTDQRRHIYQSTVAAADYLNELYKQFDDWLLVVAAYNCGSGNVYKAIRLSGSREFWKLQRFLPTETRNHVKRFIATHFYYEEKGSLATLTKTERINYLASLKMMKTKDENKINDVPVSENIFVNCVLIAQQEGEWIFEWRK